MYSSHDYLKVDSSSLWYNDLAYLPFIFVFVPQGLKTDVVTLVVRTGPGRLVIPSSVRRKPSIRGSTMEVTMKRGEMV